MAMVTERATDFNSNIMAFCKHHKDCHTTGTGMSVSTYSKLEEIPFLQSEKSLHQ
jgi:hypothetical protein